MIQKKKKVSSLTELIDMYSGVMVMMFRLHEDSRKSEKGSKGK